MKFKVSGIESLRGIARALAARGIPTALRVPGSADFKTIEW